MIDQCTFHTYKNPIVYTLQEHSVMDSHSLSFPKLMQKAWHLVPTLGHPVTIHFSFVVNPLTPVQETLCQLQNETSATNPTAVPQRSVNLYYMVKMQIRSGKNLTKRNWKRNKMRPT